MLRTIVGIILLFATTVTTAVPLYSERQPRNWQDAKVVVVQTPDDRSASPSNPVGIVTQMGGGTPSVPMLQSTGRSQTWIYVIDVAGRRYSAGYNSPSRKSYLGTLALDQPIKIAIEKRSLYVLDPKGKVWKLRLLEK